MPANRWLPASIFVVTLVVTSALLFIRVPTTAVELSGEFTGLGFVLSQQQALNRPLTVTALGASGVKDVELPEEIASHSVSSAMRIAVDSTPATHGVSGSIVVDRIVVPAGTQVWLSRTDVPREYRLSLRAPAPITLHADVMGTIAFSPAGAPRTTATMRAPRPVDFTGTTGAIDLDLTLAPGSSAPRWQQLAVRELRLHRIDDDRGSARPFARPVSTILSGSTYFESLAGDARPMRAGEMLRFGDVNGAIITLDLRDDVIAATFEGGVRDMRTGAGDHPRSLMPSLLEWLRERQGLSLMWGTAIYLFGTTMMLRRWWRRVE